MRPWLADRAARSPAALAFIGAGARLTFGELSERTDLTARRLAAAGVREGERVAIVLGPSRLGTELVHATQRLGAAVVPLSPRLTDGEIAQLTGLVRPTLAVHTAPVESVRTLSPTELGDLVPAPRGVLHDVVRDDALHSVMFTSGTSGRAKGVCLTNANHAANARASAARLGTTSDDRWLACMPICHVGGLGIVLRSAQSGFATVVQSAFDADEMLRAIRDEHVTILSVVPTMLGRLLDAAGDARCPPTLRCVLVGGGPLSAPVLDRALASGWPVAQTYGLTEASSHVTVAMPGETDVPGAVGAPIPGTEVVIDAPDADGVGEILVRGATVMQGYVGNEITGAASPTDGWLRTGDLGWLDAGGRLIIAGRRTDVIVTGGENVHPAEIESVLLRHPDVVDAAVLGVPDETWGERIEARIVVGRSPLDAEALRLWCVAQLAGFKVPKAFTAVAELPRTPTGKLRRDRLR